MIPPSVAFNLSYGYSLFCPLGGGGAPSANIPAGITVAAQVFLQLQGGREDGPLSRFLGIPIGVATAAFLLREVGW